MNNNETINNSVDLKHRFYNFLYYKLVLTKKGIIHYFIINY